MTGKAYDQFGKQYLAYLLDFVGEVKVSHEIPKQSFQIDMMFTPTATVAELQPLGTLGQMGTTTGLLEYFWNPPSKRELRTGLLKLFLVHNELYNQSRSEKKRFSEETLPHLWILATTASETFLQGCEVKSPPPTSGWCEGVYFFGPTLKTAIVVIDHLPRTPDTLWLRLLGKDTTRRHALNELRALPANHPWRNRVLQLVSDYSKKIQNQPKLNQDEKELIMELSPAYYQWEAETLQRGRQEGRRDGLNEMQRLIFENLLKLRFGVADEPLLEALLKLPPTEALSLVWQLSREELLARFGK